MVASGAVRSSVNRAAGTILAHALTSLIVFLIEAFRVQLDQAICFDIETLPNCYTLHAEALWNDWQSTWEISEFRDDREQMLVWFDHLQRNQIPMIGFNSILFDYPVIHFIRSFPQCTVTEIYDKAMQIINGNDRFAHTIWERDRFAPQIDLFKVQHFDNRAKTTSLKALQINMRSPTVVDSPVAFGTNLTRVEIERDLIPYNKHDVKETKRFAHATMKALEFRLGLVPQFGADVMNFNDTKIGSKILEQRLGDEVCFDRTSGRKQPRQSPRWRIALSDIIFPYIRFEHPEFQRVLAYMQAQVLTPDDLEDPDATIKTKGVFSNLRANVGGIEFAFGTGGIHGSVLSQRFVASEEWPIEDIDVEGLYPNIAIVNHLAPEHLGAAFTTEYAKLPAERKLFAKGTVENASYKLAGNGTYGNSNNKFSVFYDPLFTMTITINGQLMLCMLAEWLCNVPTFQMIQINTDGITYRIHRDHQPQALEVQARWEAYTMLKLERASYSRMWIADVNTYIAESTDGKLKQKGRLWHPDPLNYAASISEASPPAWHKDLGNIVSIRAAVAAMVHGLDPAVFIRLHTDPFDFMCRVKADRASHLLLGGARVQNTTRYYVAIDGAPLVKVSPPAKDAVVGTYKRKSGLSDAEYRAIAATVPDGVHDPRIHTQNKSVHAIRETAIEAGWKIAECNDASAFRFDNVNYDWYIAEARKLII